MQIKQDARFIIGTFKKELKNRFLCEVIINEVPTECYVPSSCHLSHFLQLEGEKVLLVPTQAPNSRTAYSLFAVPYKRSFIILNSSMANRAVEVSIASRRFCFLGKQRDVIKEHTVCSYKADLFLPATNTIIEVKSVISVSDVAEFPTVYSERTLNQLKKLGELLNAGYKGIFTIVSLNPYVKAIKVGTSSDMYEELKKCMNRGLMLKAYTCRLKDDKLQIDRQIPVIF